MSESFKMEALVNTGSNWPMYKAKTRAYAMSKGSLGILDGKTINPTVLGKAEGSSEAVYQAAVLAYENKNNQLWFYLTSSQSSETWNHIRLAEEGDCHGAWSMLMAFFESQSRASLKQQLQQLIEFKQGSMTIPAYLAEAFALRGRLKDAIISQKVDILDLITSMVIVQGLGPRYETLREMLFLDDMLDLDSTRAKIVEHTQRIDFDTVPALSSALAVSKVGGQGRAYEGSSCSFCGRGGHSRDQCFQLHPELKSSSPREPKNLVKELKKAKKTIAKMSASGPSQAPPSAAPSSAPRQSWFVRSCEGSACLAVQATAGIKTFELDSGSSDHIVRDASGIHNIDPNKTLKFEVADQRIIQSEGCGSIPSKLKEVHIVPSFGANLLSPMQLYRDGKATLIHPLYGIIIAEADKMRVDCPIALCRGYIENNSFKVDVAMMPVVAPAPIDIIATKAYQSNHKVLISQSRKTRLGSPTLEDRAALWLHRLGLASPQRIIDMIDHDLAKGVSLPKGMSPSIFKIDEVQAYQLAKSRAQPHRDLGMKKVSRKPFEMLHVDTETINVPSYGGSIYKVSCVCDFSRYKIIRTFARKSQLVALMKDIQREVSFMGFKIKRIRWDNGTEQKNFRMDTWLDEVAIKGEFTSTYSSASNGVAERSIQTSRKTSNAIRLLAQFPKKAWAECDKTAVFVENRLPCRANPGCESPHQMIYGEKPDLSFLRTIGSRCYVHQHKPERGDKLDPRALIGSLIGYADRTKGYRILMDPVTGECVETMHVSFCERLVRGALSCQLGHFESVPNEEPQLLIEAFELEPSVQGGSKLSQ